MAAQGATGGFVVTSGSSTEDAKSFAKGRNIELIDGSELSRMIEKAKTARSMQRPQADISPRILDTAKPEAIAWLHKLLIATIMQPSLFTEVEPMPALTIKNIPDSLYEQLKSAAELHRRSINSEVLVCLEKVLIAKKTSTYDRLQRIEQLRASIKPNIITTDDIDQAIENRCT